jgi:hypothetical protein
MARTRTLTQLIDDVRKKADVRGATARHPDADITRFINQGIAELRDLLIEARGRLYFRKAGGHPITTLADTSRYALPGDFHILISLRVQGQVHQLFPFTPDDELVLRAEGASSSLPTHYEIQPGYIELLPKHAAGETIIVEYIPTMTDLVAGGDLLDGYQGWEDYVVAYAAREIAIADDEQGVVRNCSDDMAKMALRIAKLAPKRDNHRPERVKNVRRGLRVYT